MTSDRSEVLCRQYGVTLPDAWLNIREWGSTEPDITVVLTHGWTLSGRLWEDVATSIVRAEPSARVVAYDHRGHGNSASVPTASIEQLADDLAAVVTRTVPAGPIVFGGHSLGGMTLMALAQRHPGIVAERAAAVAFVATSAGNLLGTIRRVPGTEPAMRAVLVPAARIKLPSKPLLLVRQGGRAAYGRQPRRHDMNRTALQAAQSDPRAVAALGRSILRHNRYDALPAFRHAHAVVMAGTRDPLTSPAHARRIVEKLPGSQLVVFDGAGHFLPYERREAVTAHLLNLVAKAHTLEGSIAGVAG
jgi:pimeloyl-ACP methyl ester carboxylesterase